VHDYVSRSECRKNHNIKLGNKSFESVEYFKYLGTILTRKNSIQDENKSRLKSAKASINVPIYKMGDAKDFSNHRGI
jgi:hypothetical protein